MVVVLCLKICGFFLVKPTAHEQKEGTCGSECNSVKSCKVLNKDISNYLVYLMTLVSCMPEL